MTLLDTLQSNCPNGTVSFLTSARPLHCNAPRLSGRAALKSFLHRIAQPAHHELKQMRRWHVPPIAETRYRCVTTL